MNLLLAFEIQHQCSNMTRVNLLYRSYQWDLLKKKYNLGLKSALIEIIYQKMSKIVILVDLD